MPENRQFDYFIIISMILTVSHDSQADEQPDARGLLGRSRRRFAGTLLRRLVAGFRVLAASKQLPFGRTTTGRSSSAKTRCRSTSARRSWSTGPARRRS